MVNRFLCSVAGDVLSWCRSRQASKHHRTVIAAAATTFALFCILFLDWVSRRPFRIPDYSDPSSGQDTEWVHFTPLGNARKKSAACLDGSAPVYHLQRGFGSGSDRWLLHVEGGGWCGDASSCSDRKITKLGSSKYMEHEVQFLGILSHDPNQNPDFFNWNKVKIRYCDGSSFSSNPDNELEYGSELAFRGKLIWDAIMEELLLIGMSNATQALLTGCSAGGLASLIHCDSFRNLLPQTATVKCLADASFFINEKDIAGNGSIESFYRDVVHIHGIAKSLNRECIARNEPHKCFFPEEFIRNIQTPVFIVQPAYDFWQIENILVPPSCEDSSWRSCRLYILNCNANQLQVLHGYRNSLLRRLNEFQQKPETGVFVNSCFAHCQTWGDDFESVGDWYFNRAPAIHIDEPYPSNPTCVHMDRTWWR